MLALCFCDEYIDHICVIAYQTPTPMPESTSREVSPTHMSVDFVMRDAGAVSISMG